MKLMTETKESINEKTDFNSELDNIRIKVR